MRSNSATSRMMTSYVRRSEGQRYLVELLKEPVRLLCVREGVSECVSLCHTAESVCVSASVCASASVSVALCVCLPGQSSSGG
jgi:hypothetical protein